MTVIRHVWGDEHPLWQLVRLEIFIEKSGVLDVGKSLWLRDHGVVQDLGA